MGSFLKHLWLLSIVAFNISNILESIHLLYDKASTNRQRYRGFELSLRQQFLRHCVSTVLFVSPLFNSFEKFLTSNRLEKRNRTNPDGRNKENFWFSISLGNRKIEKKKKKEKKKKNLCVEDSLPWGKRRFLYWIIYSRNHFEIVCRRILTERNKKRMTKRM